MFKKMFSLMLIALLLTCSISSCSAVDKFLTIHARTQDNDGNGIIYFYIDNDHDASAIQPIKKGETVTVNLSDYPKLNKIAFKSEDRNMYYNADLIWIGNYVKCSCWENYTNFHIDVNFYKKSAYFNKVYYETGWYYLASYINGNKDYNSIKGEVHHSPLNNALFCGGVQAIVSC
ncbi:MAG: hypothetical protein LBD03_07960 [Methanobrevibacter sp.]|jgi:hypothetical protein|nr:hypothetical protein [Candidatus Methanovirga procula]